MPAQTVMQVRRDSAANWSSTNPVLANGEMGYDTTNKLFKVGDGSTAWNSLRVMAQHNTGSAARPLLTDGAYLSGSGLVLSGLSGNYASAPDSAALSITGDIDIKVKVALTDWTPATENCLVAKWAGSGLRSYAFYVLNTGVLRLNTDPGTGFISTDSTVATGITDGATKWVRVTMDVNNGASQRVTKFYLSDNGTTWTQLGTTVTAAGATSFADTTQQLEVGSETNGTNARVNGTIYDVVIQSAYDTADNTTSLVFDANFETATADALAFTESSGNAATVTINTTRYTYGVPGKTIITTGSGAFSANFDVYAPFTVSQAISVDLVQFEVTASTASNRTMYVVIYAADNNEQPTGNVLMDFGTITIPANALGTVSKQVTPVTLQPGTYLMAWNVSASTQMRFVRYTSVMASSNNSFFNGAFRSRTNAAFGNNPDPWNGRDLSSNIGFTTPMILRWKAA